MLRQFVNVNVNVNVNVEETRSHYINKEETCNLLRWVSLCSPKLWRSDQAKLTWKEWCGCQGVPTATPLSVSLLLCITQLTPLSWPLWDGDSLCWFTDISELGSCTDFGILVVWSSSGKEGAIFSDGCELLTAMIPWRGDFSFSGLTPFSPPEIILIPLLKISEHSIAGLSLA